MKERLITISTLLLSALTAAALLQDYEQAGGVSSSRRQSVKLLLKAERIADMREGRSIDRPNLDWYILPRIFNSTKRISEGLRDATQQLALQKSRLALRKQNLSNAWSFIGPNTIAGRVRVVKFHPTNGSLAYAGSASGGLFKSTDGGLTWKAKTDHLPTLAIGHMAFDPVNPDIIYIGTGEGSSNWDAVHGDGIYKSTDGGESWTNVMEGVINEIDLAVNSIAIHPDDPNLIFAATTYGDGTGALMRSTDGGGEWKAVLNGPARTVLIDKGKPERVMVGFGYLNGRSSNGLYISDQRGDRFTFNKVTANIPASDSIGRVVLTASPSVPGTYLCAMHRAPRYAPTENQDFLGIFRSTDFGDTWVKTPASTQTNMREVLRAQGDYNLYIRFHPTDANVVFFGGINTWRSTDGGNSFRQVTTQSGQAGAWVDMHYVDFSPANPDIMLLASDGGVFRTTDCRRSNLVMQEVGAGLATMQFYSMNYDRAKPTRVAGGTQDRRNNIGDAATTNWQQLINWGGDGGWVAFDYEDANTFYVAYQYGRLGKTTNGGTSFTAIQQGLQLKDASGNYMFGFVTPFIMHPVDRHTLFVGGNKIYRTTNGGSRWHAVSANLTGQTNSLAQFQHLDFCKTNPDILYGVTGYSSIAYRTTNAMDPDTANVKWSRIDIGLPNLYLGEVAVHPANGDIAYVGTSGFSPTSGVYKTTDGGASWTFMKGESPETQLPDVPVGAIAIWERNTDVVFAGTDVGVYVSDDGGRNWRPFGEGLPNVVVDDLKITDGDIIYAATHGRGMWMASAILSTEAESDRRRPVVFSLGQNYPNPVRNGAASMRTVLPFTLEKPGDVTVTMYDSQGKELRTLLDEYREPGPHRIEVSADGLRAGAYFYELRSGSQREVRKMVVVR